MTVNIKQILSLFICVPLAASAAHEAADALPHRYDEIAPEYLSTFPIGDQTDHRDEKGKSGLNLSMPELTKRQIASLLLKPLKRDEEFLGVEPASGIANKDVWNGVRLYTNAQHKPANTLVGTIKPITQVGRLVLSRLLTDLTDDVTVLHERQDLIRLLASDDHEFGKYTMLLEKFCKHESSLLAMLRPNDSIKDPQLPRLLGHQKGAAPLTAFNKTFSELLSAPLTLFSLPIAYLYWRHTTLPTLAFANGIENGVLRNGLKFGAWVAPVMYALMPLLIPYSIMQRKKVYLYTKQRLRSLHYFTKTLARIDTYDLPIIGPQVAEIIGSRSEKVDALVEALADKSLRKKDWYLQGGANVYRSLDAISEGALRKTMRGLHVIGQLDAYLAIARLMRTHKDHPVKYCYTQYTDTDNAQIEAIDFWHPSLPPEKAVANSLQMGMADAPRGLVLTGVNEGGKSTAMRALALGLVLGQTFGIAPARRFVFTPFSIIRMSMNTVDDLGADKSLFKVEIDNSYTMVAEADSLSTGKRCVYFLDEIFTGTERVEGEAAAYGIARRLVQRPHCLVFLATHYQGLTNLEHDTNGAYKNMHVRVDIKDGVFTYPYRLLPGPTTQQIAIDILEREKFNQTIIDMARRVLSSPDQFIPTAADV